MTQPMGNQEPVQSAPITQDPVTPSQSEPINILGSTPQSNNTNIPAVSQPESVDVTKNFIDILPDTLKGEKSLAKFKSIEDLAKGYINAEKMIGKKVTDMSPEELKAINTKLGVPESPDKYTFEKVENADETLTNWFKNAAHEAGISQDAATKLYNQWNANASEMQKMMESQAELQSQQYVADLKKEFGAAFDQRVELANKAVRQFGGDDLIKMLNETGLGNHPALVKTFAEAGKLLSEGTLPSSENSGRYGLTPAEARQKIIELKSDQGFQKMRNSIDPGQRQQALKMLEDLYRIEATGR